MKLAGASAKDIDQLCLLLKPSPDCSSVEKEPIFYYDRLSSNPDGKKIFVMALIHGDEIPSGMVAISWLLRLSRIDPRNSWRVIPVASPDGTKAKTRTNKSAVDLNRNFPTKEWDDSAVQLWKKQGADPRRNPGPEPASEPETKCLLKHFEEYKPDFIISIHTPLGVLDFDGPKMNYPAFPNLPWKSLGNFPGSLGRYMWKDNSIPVLTIELRGNEGVKRLEDFDKLQDISGTVAIKADQIKRQQQSKESNADKP